MNKILFRCSP